MKKPLPVHLTRMLQRKLKFQEEIINLIYNHGKVKVDK